MNYLCSDEEQIIGFAKNADKIQMVCDLFNNSKFQLAAQSFLSGKGVDLRCKYSYAVSDPATQKPASYIFFATDKTTVGYYVKVNIARCEVAEWYRHDDIQRKIPVSGWAALDIDSGKPVEYYKFDNVDGFLVEKKYNSKTKELLSVNNFQKFAELTAEQQELIRDLPFKRTSVCWSNKPYGFTVEFLPSYTDVYDGINMANLHLLEV